MRRRLLLTVCLMLPAPLHADSPLEKGIDELAAKYHVTHTTPGVAVAVIEPGKATLYKTYGLANLARGTPITRYTIFELASLSKPLTALVILRLCDRGLMSLDDPVSKYIPELPGYDKDHSLHVRDLLHQVSGLPE